MGAIILVYLDLTAVVAIGHRWIPYEQVAVLSRALTRYLELVWTDQTHNEPFPEVLRLLAMDVTLDGVNPE